VIDPTELFQRQWEDQDPATAHINRLADQNAELKAALSDIISSGRRDRSIISPALGPLHLIDTQVTKGQVLRAIKAIKNERD